MNTIIYKGFTIEIEHDDYAENPFDAWDGNAPILVHPCGHFERAPACYGLEFELPALSKEEIKANLKEVRSILGYSSLMSALTELAPACRASYFGDIEQYVNDSISKIFDDETMSDQIELIAQVYRMKSIPAIVQSVRGSARGDYAEVLAVALPSWIEETGVCPEFIESNLRGAISLYGSWAYGEVYGYSIEGIGDSGCGFYGSDHGESGLLEQARDTIDWRIEMVRKKRISQLKVYIKNRVPMASRWL